jgi:dTDP-4-dehydrorhamnose reductase
VSGRPLRVLVAGREGQLARALAPAFAGAGWDVAAWGRPALDLAGPADAIADAVRANAPDLVVNAAAYTAVDRAETEPAAAMAVNRDGAAALAAAAAAGAPMLHVSTDYVFDGDKGTPYAEDDAPAPGATHHSSWTGRCKR